MVVHSDDREERDICPTMLSEWYRRIRGHAPAPPLEHYGIDTMLIAVVDLAGTRVSSRRAHTHCTLLSSWQGDVRASRSIRSKARKNNGCGVAQKVGSYLRLLHRTSAHKEACMSNAAMSQGSNSVTVWIPQRW